MILFSNALLILGLCLLTVAAAAVAPAAGLAVAGGSCLFVSRQVAP